MVIKSNVMRKIITLVLLLSFACSEETEFRCESCINMTISDAMPIQFWLNDCPTYNEKESCGVHSFCWNQKFDCDDEIRLQVINNEEDQELSLQLLNEAGELVTEIPFEAEEINISITEEVDLQFSTTDFTSGLGDWVNYNGNDGGTYIAFTPASPGARANGSPSSTPATKYLSIARNDGSGRGWPPGDYEVRVYAENNSGGTQTLIPQIYGMLTSTSQVYVTTYNSGNIPDGGALTEVTVQFTLDQYYPFIAILFYRGEGPGGGFYMDVNLREIEITEAPTSETYTEYSRTIFNMAFIPSELSPEICNEKVQFVIVDDNTSPAEIAKSDFVEFSDNLTCTQLIKYRNQRNFAGIDYENLYTDTSPEEAEYFYLRIPAIFFHEQFPGEDEVAELSDSKIINLNGVMRSQKRLETDYIPYYMHKKIQLILKHQFVEIESQRWTKQDAYEITEGNKRYPLKMAKCWLTERNFVARNVV